MASYSIAHISDLHCGSPYFVPELLDAAIDEINERGPDVLVVSGDLTNEGFLPEFELARSFIDRIEVLHKVIIPGNHDARNVGYEHFEDVFGPRYGVLHAGPLTIVSADSSEPDLDYGTVGRGHYKWIEECFAHDAQLRIFVLHHHLMPVPGTGRERNIVHDAGDALETLMRSRVDMVLSGHKHVPYAWRMEDMFIVNTGTVSTSRVRGRTRPCYLWITGDEDQVMVERRYPQEGAEEMLRFSPITREYTKSIDLHPAPHRSF
jgi:3',5'-cyclic AMP phosphodiesterase CpdA